MHRAQRRLHDLRSRRAHDRLRPERNRAVRAAVSRRGADYAERRTLDLGKMEPLVAMPGTVLNNAVAVSEVRRERIDQAFIGSCANGNLDDLEIAADVLRAQGRTGRALPGDTGSQEIYRQALKAGYRDPDGGRRCCHQCDLRRLSAAATWACWPNETCITASTRNFSGRMGDPSARIYMASPATVAALA